MDKDKDYEVRSDGNGSLSDAKAHASPWDAARDGGSRGNAAPPFLLRQMWRDLQQASLVARPIEMLVKPAEPMVVIGNARDIPASPSDLPKN